MTTGSINIDDEVMIPRLKKKNKKKQPNFAWASKKNFWANF